MLSSRILSEESLDAIHYATLEALEKTRIVVESDKALKILEEEGCTVDYRKHLALIPPHVVKEDLMRKPKNITLYARNPCEQTYALKTKNSFKGIH
ncbi:MAG: trimethylamine methyltransferase family protein [Candidatus Bathyarchaeota archaeon]|nr:trimethylamine methyltransferase family protein [Candidatus Bathyarchaeota archaeon]MDH5712607.1 trimethylamine methyltransferase family protein [Candidatus Bathyarchaeota archaeon]